MRRTSEGIKDGERVALVMQTLADKAGVDYWSCDGGTALAAVVAHRLGIVVEQEVGHYWHQRAETLVAIRGGEVLDYANQPMDEHHHWLVGDGWLYDANGELREEAKLQAITDEVLARYEFDEDLDFDEYLDCLPADWIAEMAPPLEKLALSMVEEVVAEMEQKLLFKGPGLP